MHNGDTFGEAFNLGYSPQLEDDQRLALINSMRERGILEETRTGKRWDPCISLTPASGELWERERRPVWEAFLRDSWRVQGGTMTIRASRKEIAEEYVAAGNDAGLFETRGTPEIRSENDMEIVPWRRARVVELTLQLFKSPRALDWAIYESRRIWWKSVPSLLISHGARNPLPGHPNPPPLFRDPTH